MEEGGLEMIVPRCGGLDVHKNNVVVCARLVVGGGKLKKEVREFGTMTRDLLALSDWLRHLGVTDVAMESTGVFWKPIYNILEGNFNILLVNAQHIKQVRGRKTDVKDCEWIAQLLQCGLLKASFVGSKPLRQLRDLTRHRAQLTMEQTREANRVHKILQDANIKLSSVATDILGVSGRSMIRAIIEGRDNPNELAEMARRRLRGKIPELRFAMQGRVNDHHRFMLKMHLDHYEHIGKVVEELSVRIETLMNEQTDPQALTPPIWAESAMPKDEPDRCKLSLDVPASESARPRMPLNFEQSVRLLATIPGVEQTVAQAVVAEIGTDMSQFPTEMHLSSWAGMCPGNNESAGKRKSGKTTKGSRWLRSSLCQAAWATTRTNTYLAAQYHRLAPRRGKKRAIIAVGHTMLIIIYHMLKNHVAYNELGADWFDKINPEKLTRYLVKRLESLGHKVTLEKPPACA